MLKLVTVFFGANVGLFPIPNLTFPLEKYATNLREMIAYLGDANDHQMRETGCPMHILLITPPPVYDVAVKASSMGFPQMYFSYAST